MREKEGRERQRERERDRYRERESEREREREIQRRRESTKLDDMQQNIKIVVVLNNVFIMCHYLSYKRLKKIYVSMRE